MGKTQSLGMEPKSQLRLRLYVSLFMLDVLVLRLAFLMGDVLRDGLDTPAHYAAGAMAVLPIYIVLATHSGAYTIDVLREPRLGVQRATRSLLFALASFIGIAFYLKPSAEYSRSAFGLSSIFSLVLLAGGRWAFGLWQGRAVGWRFTNDVVLVDGISYHPHRGEIVLMAEEGDLRPSLNDPAVDRIWASRSRIACSE